MCTSVGGGWWGCRRGGIHGRGWWELRGSRLEERRSAGCGVRQGFPNSRARVRLMARWSARACWVAASGGGSRGAVAAAEMRGGGWGGAREPCAPGGLAHRWPCTHVMGAQVPGQCPAKSGPWAGACACGGRSAARMRTRLGQALAGACARAWKECACHRSGRN